MKGTGISRLQKRNRRNKTAAGNVRPVFKKMNLNTVMTLYTFLIVVPVVDHIHRFCRLCGQANG